MSSIDERAAWLALLFGGRLKRQVAKAALYRWCVEGNKPAGELLALPAEEARAAFELDEQQAGAPLAAALLAAVQDAPTWAARLRGLSARSVELVLRADPAYPDALVQRLPEAQLPYCLFARGDLALLSEPVLSIQGSVQPSIEAQQAARDLANALRQAGQTLVGGYEQGIDRLALDATRGVGGSTIVLPPSGLDAFQPTLATFEAALSAGQLLVLSPYAPEQAYTAALGLARSALITALSEAVFLFEPSVGPDAWPGYGEARSRGLQTFIWACSSAPADAWIAGGALAFADAKQACQHVGLALGLEPPPSAPELGVAEEHTLYESPHYANAEEAIEALRRAGAVPPALARRLRQAGWPAGDDK